MNKEFIPYEQALEMFELGFRETCMKWYDGIRLVDEYANNTGHWDLNCAAAPLYQQAFRWFREKHQLDHFVQHHIDGTNQTYFSMARKSTWDVTTHDTYEEAEIACLKKLIEIVKNK